MSKSISEKNIEAEPHRNNYVHTPNSELLLLNKSKSLLRNTENIDVSSENSPLENSSTFFAFQ